MSNTILRVCLAIIAWVSSVLLFFFTIYLGLGEAISAIAALPLIIISAILFVGGFIIFFQKGGGKQYEQTTDDSEKKETVLTEADIKKQKKTAYILGFILIVAGILSRFFGAGLNVLLIAVGIVILIWAWFRPIKKK